jgi:hypothetical protein
MKMAVFLIFKTTIFRNHITLSPGHLHFVVAEVLLGDAEDAEERHPGLLELLPRVPAELTGANNVLLQDVLKSRRGRC